VLSALSRGGEDGMMQVDLARLLDFGKVTVGGLWIASKPPDMLNVARTRAIVAQGVSVSRMGDLPCSAR
jgi:hypothetical protein